MKNKFFLPLLFLLLTGVCLTACSNDNLIPKHKTDVSLNFNTEGLYSSVSSREADGAAEVEVSVVLECTLYYKDGTVIASDSVELLQDTTEAKIEFSGVPVDSEVYAKVVVKSVSKTSDRTTESIMYSGTSETKLVTQEGAKLSVSLTKENGSSQEEIKEPEEQKPEEKDPEEKDPEGDITKPEEKDPEEEIKDPEDDTELTFTITVTASEGSAFSSTDTSIVPKQIDLYAIKGDISKEFKGDFSSTELLALSNLSQNDKAKAIKSYNSVNDSNYYTKKSDNSFAFKDAFKAEDFLDNQNGTEETLNLIAIVGFGSNLGNGYSNCYVGYAKNFKPEEVENNFEINLISMNGSPGIFEFWYGQDSSDSNARLLSEYTTAAVVQNMDTTYVQYSEVQTYAGDVITSLFQAGYKYDSYITGKWNGIFKTYQPYYIDKTNDIGGSVDKENRALVLGITCPTESIHLDRYDITITFTATRVDGKTLTQEELNSIRWEASLSYDGNDINKYGTTYYTVENNVITINPDDNAPLEAAGIYQLYLKATWPMFEGATGEEDVLISSQTFNIVVEE
jgi:hypothetical protein